MTTRTTVLAALAVAGMGLLASTAIAGDSILATKSTKIVTVVTPSWMSPDVAAAWALGYKGAGVTITMVDEFSGPNSDKFSGNFGQGVQNQLHGLWTREEASMIAPSATIVSKDFNSGTAVTLKSGLNVINLSYAMFATAGYNVNQIGWSNQEKSIIAAAMNGKAVISKAAGNDSVVMGARTSSGLQDYLGDALIGAPSAIFVGALNSNGTTTSKASLAYYSDTAGTNKAVQSHFLVVGVTANTTGLAGTSFAAPIITGYAAILGSKFRTATPTQITNRLLTTARTDTLLNYNAATYGMGEAILSRAVAPNSIN
jgi:subtilisin family serine protease